jgi:3-phenylpropionate/trans-cinnamate dioxygenase ferredoxin reductase component
VETYRYLIVGGGMTAAAAVKGIREVDPDGTIGMIGAESDPPYNRPPLTKGLWKGKPFEKIWRDVEGVALQLGRTVEALDRDKKQVTDDQGNVYGYEKLLLATGGTPRRLPFGGDSVMYFRTVQDYLKLREMSEAKPHVAVIGGGFIGSEIAAALASAGCRITILFPEDGIGAVPFPRDLSQFLNGYYRDKGVEVMAGEMVSDIQPGAGGIKVICQNGTEVTADAVVAGLGIAPNVKLAQASGLDVDNGITVDEMLRTSDPSIYAAGDVANFPNAALGKRMRVEHEDNANTMGKIAGRSMAGQGEAYHHQPAFYSDMFELGYEAVGELDARLETFADWQEPFQKGVVYYLTNARVRGVLLWNVWDKVDAARALIEENGPFDAGNLKGRIG